ncbi:MAG: hypothetical protein IKJ74_00350 [Clostridia bacterium]|nr:hypothetical protein [Clostridia bacterium]
MLRLCFFALFAVILSAILAPLSPKIKTLLTVATGILILIFFMESVTPILKTFSTLTERSGLTPLFELVWKGLGLSLLVSVCADLCRDMGENGIATKLEMGGKGALLCLSIPVLEEIMVLLEEIAP